MDIRSMWLVLGGVIVALLALIIEPPGGVRGARAQSAGTQGLAPGLDKPVQLAQFYFFPNFPYPQEKRKKTYRRRRAAPLCKTPWTYSRGLQKCICVQEGYSISNGQCVKTAEICPKNAKWSDAEKKCACLEGYTLQAGECIDPNSGVVSYDPSGNSQCLWPRIKSVDNNGCVCAEGYREETGQCVRGQDSPQMKHPRAAPGQLLTSEVSVVQECLKEAGYLRAPVQETMGRPAWTAFWFFKQDYSVGRTPNGVHDAGAQHKLFTLCPKTSQQLAALPAEDGPAPGGARISSQAVPKVQPAAPGGSPTHAAMLPARAAETDADRKNGVPTKKIYARPETNCLPDDLYRLIVDTYGPRPKLKRCTQTCIAKPANITDKESKEYESRRGVRWCRACIEIGTPLPLDDVLRLERGANVQVCTRPPSRLPKWVSRATSGSRSYSRVRSLYAALPRNLANKNNIAVIIGNATYGHGIPKNSSAAANAGAFYALLTEHLGFEDESIIDLRDAKLDAFTKVFGDKGDAQGELGNRLQKNPEASVFIYYTGHAGTLPDGSDSYLLPVDATKYREDRSGYRLSHLYSSLQKMGAKSVLVLLEADFGRDLSDYVFAPNLPEMQVRAMPVSPLPGMSVLTAADGDQKTLDDPALGIGLFTRSLIEGLAGRADLSPIGNGDGKIDAVELYAYTSHMVRLSARKSYGLLQKPMMSHSGNLRVSRVQTKTQ